MCSACVGTDSPVVINLHSLTALKNYFTCEQICCYLFIREGVILTFGNQTEMHFWFEGKDGNKPQ
jgi:hypothetical protein